jgi:Zn-dependent protease with chaperone function
MITNSVKLTSQFQLQTSRAVAAIILFVFVYVMILLMTVGLTALCIYAGYLMVSALQHFVVLALGIGLVGMGFPTLIFVLKFIFSKHKIDRSDLLEVTEDEQPDLFRLIQNIVEQVGTSFPKRVYLSADVNASVFYDSNFWSMFLPIRKNLLIGMGLVNTVTHDELKAILAHEFGHFSQRTMKVGSYVYNGIR